MINSNTQTKSPSILNDISDSPEIFTSCQKIGNEYGLHLDQVGELDAQVRQILKGQAKSSTFVEDIMEFLEINKDLANKIATDVNKEIFGVIKSQMQSEIADRSSEIHALEQVGGFEILKDNGHSQNVNGAETETASGYLSSNRVENIQADNLLESPAPIFGEPVVEKTKSIKSVSSTPVSIPEIKPEVKIEPVRVVPINKIPENLPVSPVETPVSVPTMPPIIQEKIIPAPPKMQENKVPLPPIQKKEYMNDPYREPF